MSTRELRPRRARNVNLAKTRIQKPHIALYTNPNTTGLAALPVELVLLITTFLPGFPVPCVDDNAMSNPENFFRSQALIALSLTCRSVRDTVLPLVWRSIEVVEVAKEDLNIATSPWSKPSPRALDKALAIQLVRKLETVTIREPQYASSVR